MALNNLKAEIARHGVKQQDIANHLNCSLRSVNGKINGDISFSLAEALSIKKEFFPDVAFDELYEDSATK